MCKAMRRGASLSRFIRLAKGLVSDDPWTRRAYLASGASSLAAIFHQRAFAAARTLPRVVAKERIYLFLQQTNTFNPAQNIFLRTFWTLHGAPTLRSPGAMVLYLDMTVTTGQALLCTLLALSRMQGASKRASGVCILVPCRNLVEGKI